MLIDSHCHLNLLDLTKYPYGLEEVLEAAKKNNITYFLNVCVDLINFPQILSIAKNYDNIYASVGIHPNEKMEKEPSFDEILNLAKEKKVIAIGETGLDYYRTDEDNSFQDERFRKHIAVALEIKKPLIIHTRQAREDTIKIMQEEQAQNIGGVMHCFTEDYDTAKKALDLGFYISFSGIITFKNAKELHELVKLIPLDRMLIETDSPYLAPVPFRGQPNQPAYVLHVAERIAELKNISFEEVAEKTSKNFLKLFNIQNSNSVI